MSQHVQENTQIKNREIFSIPRLLIRTKNVFNGVIVWNVCKLWKQSLQTVGSYLQTVNHNAI